MKIVHEVWGPVSYNEPCFWGPNNYLRKHGSLGLVFRDIFHGNA